MMLPEKCWRLNNLYRIIDKDGRSIPFVLNAVQNDFILDPHNRKITLKARQLGMSTACVINMLDDAIFTPNLACGIVSYSMEHAQHIFKRIIGHALDTWLREYSIVVPVINRSAREITFGNGSVLRVDTTLRGGTYPNVLISEFGKTCARNPQKAEEVITGTLNAVPINGKVIIESTGEGSSGFFCDMIQQCVIRGNDNLSPLEYKLFFYNWLWDNGYQMTEKIEYPIELTDYFNKYEKENNSLISQYQRNWYALQWKLLGDKVKQEFPTTISEAFLSTSDAFYFALGIEKAYQDNRCLNSNIYDALLPVYCAFDIGVNDLTVIIFFQLAHGEIRIIDYYSDNNKGVDFYSKFLLQEKKYLYHTIFLPHDSVKRDAIIVENTYERDFKRLFIGTSTKFHVLKRIDKQLSISHSKIKLDRCVFNINKVKKLLEMIGKYRKKWHEPTGRYLDEPLHDISCFVGETLIETEMGKKRIDEIVLGDMVMTPTGFKKVLKIFKHETKNLLKLNFYKKSITCTPHHKIFTNKGLVTADSLRYNDHIITIKDEALWKQIGYRGREKNLGFKDYFLSMNQKQLFDLMDTSTRKISSDIGLEGLRVQKMDQELCIGQFGYTLMGKLKRNLISIISTVINQIMALQIWNLFHTPNICVCTCQQKSVKPYQEEVLVRLSKHQKDGIDQMLVGSGIQSMEKKHLRRRHLSKKNVYAVEKFIFQCKNLANIVLLYVNRHLGVIPEKIMKIEPVRYVSKNIFAINMTQKKHVQNHVEQCLGIEREVFDLTIEDDNCYFANGFLVSNSNYADAFQYLCQGVSHLETVSSMQGSLEKHKAVVENRLKRII